MDERGIPFDIVVKPLFGNGCYLLAASLVTLGLIDRSTFGALRLDFHQVR